MSYPALLEVFASLTVQVTLLVGVAAWAIRRQRDKADADGPWAAVHGCILLLTAAAILLPHLRPVTMGDLRSSTSDLVTLSYYQLAGKVCLWLWISGTAAVLVAIAGGIWRATDLSRHATPSVPLSKLANQFEAAANLTHRPLEVRVSQVSVVPFCWQFHQPIIVVPDLLFDMPPTEQAAVLKHELAHLALRHPLHLFLQRLVEAIFWYHPVVWWSSQQAATAREFRCDRESIRNRREVADYLRSLLRMIESQMSAPVRLPAGLGFLDDRSLLKRRTLALTEFSDRPIPQHQRRAQLFGLALSAIVIGTLIWLPVNPLASRRAYWSPWPRWSATAMDAGGVPVRDYEVDGHRLRPHEHRPR